jgi:hypothetical protein
MGEHEQSDERAWAADKRDFVADNRDEIAAGRDVLADARDAIADERERIADERDAELDERERQLDVLGGGEDPPDALGDAGRDSARAARVEAAVQREEARDGRDLRAGERRVASDRRENADRERTAATSSTHLAAAFAEIACYFVASESFDDVLTRIVEAAVATVSGCELSSITLREADGRLRTPVMTDEDALAVDREQYETREGPCLDALDEAVVLVGALPDARWPELGERPVEAGVHAVSSYRIDLGDDRRGSLNAYGRTPGAFDDHAVGFGLILAAHGSAAVRFVAAREGADRIEAHLTTALASREVIGEAKGILMERLRVTPEEAFDILRRSSQHLNVKRREVALRLTETGEIP